MKNKIYVMLPAYNEEKNLEELITKWENQKKELNNKGFELEITVINDASTDNTENIVKQIQNKYSNLRLINHEINKGLSGGLNTGINSFLNRAKENDLLVFMDADNTHEPMYVNEMIDKLLDGSDCVIASRYKNNSDIKGLTNDRRMMSDLARYYYSFVLNVPNVKDYTCGYRVYKYEIIKKLQEKYGDEPIKEKSFACMMELLYKVYDVGAKFDEVGFVLRYDNKKGESKMKVFNTAKKSITTAIKLKKSNILIKIFLVILAIFLSFNTNYSPLNNQDPYCDSAIYAYMGMAFLKGKTLYTEAWDNKGPVLYSISIYLSALYAYKIIYLFTNKKEYSLLGTMYSMILLNIAAYGSLCENFALPLMSIQTYIVIKYFKNNFNISKKQIVFLGITTAWIAMIRINLLSIFLGAVISILIELLFEKKFKKIWTWLFYGSTGFGLAIVPYVIYFIKNNAFFECMNSVYFGVMSGFNTGGIANRLSTTFLLLKDMNITFSVTLMFILSFVFVIKIIKNKNSNIEKFIMIFSILSFIINTYAISLSGYEQVYYCISFIPIIAVFFGWLLNIIIKNNVDYKYFKNKERDILLIGIILIIILPQYLFFVGKIVNNSKPNRSIETKQIIEAINKYTNIDEEVQVIGGIECLANYKTKRISPTKYEYLPMLNGFTDQRKHEINMEFTEEIFNSNTKMIIIKRNILDVFLSYMENIDKWNDFIEKNYETYNNIVNNYIVYLRKNEDKK